MTLELLTVAEMQAADRAAITLGVSGVELMERAGAAAADAIMDRWTPRPVVVVAGPGNNGGDGFVVARLLEEAGWPVRLALLGDRSTLAGDAAVAAERWDGPALPASPAVLGGAELVVDALFGAGLNRDIEGEALALVQAMAAGPAPIVAIDVPSGLSGDEGRVRGGCAGADLTITFVRKKPGHLLLPGRSLCGELVVAPIGLPAAVIDAIQPRAAENGPEQWGKRYPWPRLDGHKYGRGHAVVYGGAVMTGAARLAVRGALRAGAGLVTVASPPAAFPIYAASMPTVIVQPMSDEHSFAGLLRDPRRNVVLLGPGAGADKPLLDAVLAAVEAGKSGVLDADVFACFASTPGGLPPLSDRWLLTPHEGEFARLFPDLTGSKLDRARAAAGRTGAVVLLKGPDTVIARPDGQAVISANGTADLATAGSGDVLAGFALGLLAQGADAFDAGCMAAWLHGEVGRVLGPGLIAEDLPEALPPVLRWLKESAGDFASGLRGRGL